MTHSHFFFPFRALSSRSRVVLLIYDPESKLTIQSHFHHLGIRSHHGPFRRSKPSCSFSFGVQSRYAYSFRHLESLCSCFGLRESMSYWDKFGGLSCSSAKFTSFRSCIHSLYSWTLPKSGIFVDPKICSNFIFTLILSSILNLDYMYYFRSTHLSIFHFHYFVNYFLFYFIFIFIYLFYLLLLYYIIYKYISFYYLLFFLSSHILIWAYS